MTDSLRRLLVDDERIQRLIVTRVAESIGFTVDGAADLDEAAEWLARRRYDAIVLDLSLGAREGIMPVAQGVRLSLDDFGTGHSSLLSLMRLPFNELKTDRSFVTNCETGPEAWKIIRVTISLAHEFWLDVVAEGVESAEVEQRLIGAGCDIGQGWRFGRPMAGSAVEAWFDAYAAALADANWRIRWHAGTAASAFAWRRS